MKRTIKIFSRYCSLDNQGQGRVTVDVFNGLKNNYNVLFNGLPAHRKSNYWFLWHLLCGKLLDFRKSEINLAITPMDTFWLNPNKSFVIIHDLIPLISNFEIRTHYNNSFIDKFGSFFLFYFSLKRALKFKKIICISSKTRDELITAFPEVDKSKIVVINNGIQSIYNKCKRLNNKPKFKLYYVGAIDPRKQVVNMINWFNNANLENVELIIGGKGHDYNECLELSRNNPNIKMLGFVNESDMLKNYCDCDAFIFPTKEEGFGMPIAEAGCCYRPVLTLAESKIPQEVKDCCLVANDWGDMSVQVYRLKNEPEYWEECASNSYYNSVKFKYDYVDRIKDVIENSL